MGWVLSIPFARADRNIVAVLRARGFTTCAFAADGEHSLAEVAASRPNRLAMIVGAESTGLRPDTLADADLRVRIPIVSSVDSLNVATAVAIGLYEFTRSPRRPDGPGDCPPRG
jgi:tRNA G18 (ribose-2'-O)-methylase SpoU